MTNFVTIRAKSINAKELVEELLINDKGLLENFRAELKGTTFIKELPTIINYIQHFANGNSVGGRVKYLKNVKDGYTEYEFITKHLRIYAIQMPNKKIILFAGIKARHDSSDNISAFREVKKRYLFFMTNQ